MGAFEFKPHSEKQERAIFSPKPRVVCGTGIQWGKTRVGAVRMAIAMHRYTDPGDNFIISAPTYKILHQSTLPAFLRLMTGRGVYSKADETFKMFGGGTCYMRTAAEPDSVVGITDVREIWLDEGDKVSLYFYENLEARAAFRNAALCVTTSPYSLGWLYKTIILPKMKDPKARPDVELIQARSEENPYFPKITIERARATMAPRRFRMLFGGQWEKMEGLVYDCFDADLNTCAPFTLPPGTIYYVGGDWGHTHPHVQLVRAITQAREHYQVAEFYKSGLILPDMIQVARQKMATWGIKLFYMPPDRPENIKAFCQAGIPTVAARDDVLFGIEKHYELIRTRRYKVFRGTSPHTMDEYEKYHWPSEEEEQELGPDKDRKERKPVKQFDDAMDANRYVTIETAGGDSVKRAPRTSSPADRKEPQYKRLERLKAPVRNRTEHWS